LLIPNPKSLSPCRARPERLNIFPGRANHAHCRKDRHERALCAEGRQYCAADGATTSNVALSVSTSATTSPHGDYVASRLTHRPIRHSSTVVARLWQLDWGGHLGEAFEQLPALGELAERPLRQPEPDEFGGAMPSGSYERTNSGIC